MKKLVSLLIVINILVVCKMYGAEVQPDTIQTQVWKILKNQVKINSSADFKNTPTVYQLRPSLDISSQSEFAAVKPTYKPTDLSDAVELLLKANEQTKNSENYRSDLVLFTRQALANLALTVHERMAEAVKNNNVRKFVKHAADFSEIAEDIDVLTGSDMHVFDLLKWEKYIELQKQSLLSGNPIDENEYNEWCAEFDKNKKTQQQDKQKIMLESNTVKTATLFFEKYKFHLISNYYALQ